MDLSSWGWKVLLGAHVLTVIVGFGPLFVYPLLIRLGAHRSPVERAAVAEVVRTARRKVSEPAFLIVGPLGVATAAAHPDPDLFQQTWVRWAIALWLSAAAVVWFVQRPLSRRVAMLAGELAASSDEPVAARNAAGRLRRASMWLTRVTWVSWAGLLVMLWLMVFRPG